MTLLIAIAAVVTLAVSVALTRQMAKPQAWVSILDQPNARSLHDRPIPRTGGLAILTSYACGTSLLFAAGAYTGSWPQTANRSAPWLIGMLLVVAAVSICDDRWGVPALFRFACHLLAAAGFVLGAGVSITTISVPLVGTVNLGAAATPLSILVIVWMTNLFNFMDGMDGLAAAMSIAGFGVLGYLGFRAGEMVIAWTAVSIVPAVAGFLVYNRPPASIFLGDSGSTTLGFLAGAVSVLGSAHRAFDPIVAFLAFSPFVVDATLTLIRRSLRRERVWEAHRQHYYQRVVLSAWSHARTLRWEVAVMIASAIAAIAFQRAAESLRAVVLLSAVAMYAILAGAVRRLERIAGRGQTPEWAPPAAQRP